MNLDEVEIVKGYIEAGYSVIPVRDKVPLVKWEQYQEYAADDDDLNAWIKQFSTMGIAIVTGSVSELIVIDIDVKGGEHPSPEELIEAGLPLTREEIITTLISKTGGGGSHLFYRYSDSDIHGATRLIEGEGWAVDVRGEGGYVVAPPSKHGNGNRYQWYKSDVEPLTLPESLATWLRDSQITPSSIVTFEAPEVIPIGERHNILMKYGCSLRGKGYDRDLIINAIIGYYAKAKVPSDPEMDFEEICALADDICFRYEKGNEQEKGALRWGTGAWEVITAPVIPGQMTGSPGIDEIGGIKQGLYVIAARPGEGKTTFLATIAPYMLRAGLKTLVLTSEMNPNDFGQWVRKGMDDDTEFKDLFTKDIFGINQRPGIIDASYVAKMMEQYHPDVLILDHIGKLHYKGQEGSRPLELQYALNLLHSTALETGTAIVAAAHLNRGRDVTGKLRPSFADLRESGAVENTADIIVYMYTEKGADLTQDMIPMYFDCAKNRHFGIMYDVDIVMNRPARRIEIDYGPRKLLKP